MKTIYKLSPDEIATAVKQWIYNNVLPKSETSGNSKINVKFDVSDSYRTSDPRERNTEACLNGATVEVL